MSKTVERVRAVDRIDTGPRFTEADAIRLNRLFRGTDTLEMLTSTLKSGLAGDVAVVSSFGAESAVLLHLVYFYHAPRFMAGPATLLAIYSGVAVARWASRWEQSASASAPDRQPEPLSASLPT